ncbi:hypothetical protein FRC18_010681 [Serendipita sp. 400]|nr:hypothetical protein FRC18_010681 [Serendipita sp. 400]
MIDDGVETKRSRSRDSTFDNGVVEGGVTRPKTRCKTTNHIPTKTSQSLPLTLASHVLTSHIVNQTSRQFLFRRRQIPIPSSSSSSCHGQPVVSLGILGSSNSRRTIPIRL